ncbi:MAG: hypothetical protein R3A10_17860 [Caldilineaceae bacterium]
MPLDDPLHFVPLEEIILHNLGTLFPGMRIVAAYPFRVTRNADVARSEDEADDLVDMIAEELREQKFAPVVRLEVAENMPRSMASFLQRELELENNDVYYVRGPLRWPTSWRWPTSICPSSNSARGRRSRRRASPASTARPPREIFSSCARAITWSTIPT